jgi:hypothetical protein
MLTADRHDTQTTNVRLPIIWREALAAHGIAEGEPLSVIIRRALREYIERNDIAL